MAGKHSQWIFAMKRNDEGESQSRDAQSMDLPMKCNNDELITCHGCTVN